MDTLLTIVETVKNLCFNVLTVLTVMVALGNELGRLRMPFLNWLTDRQDAVRKSWYTAMVVFLALSLLYSLLKHTPAPLVVDALTVAAMAYGVHYLRTRGGKPTTERRDDADGYGYDDEERIPRRPVTRTPRTRDGYVDEDSRPERVPRQRRPRRRRGEVDDHPEGDD